MRIYIGYQDGTGTEREISDLRKEADKTIDAFATFETTVEASILTE